MMKNLKYFLLIAITGAFTALIGCGDKNDPQVDPADAVRERISKTWVVDNTKTANQVMTPAGDRTLDFTNFSLTFTEDNAYSTTGNPERSPWPASGTWSFTNEDNLTSTVDTFSITRNDGLVISATLSSNDEQLALSFTYDEALHDGSARVNAVDGEWTFILVAQ